MTFGYRQYITGTTPGSPEGVRYRPVISVRVSGPKGHVDVSGLLDTGADVTMLPAFLLPIIGAKYDGAQSGRFRGIGGQLVTAHYAAVDLTLKHPDEVFRWNANVAFLEGNVAILGRAEFLNYFNATFDSELWRVHLRPNKKFPGQVER